MTAMQYLAKQLCAEDPTWLLRFAAELADLRYPDSGLQLRVCLCNRKVQFAHSWVALRCSFAAGISFADVRNELHRLRGID